MEAECVSYFTTLSFAEIIEEEHVIPLDGLQPSDDDVEDHDVEEDEQHEVVEGTCTSICLF